MKSLDKIQNIFPSITEVPMNVVIPELLEQKHYLLDGELITWEGHTQDVFSPVFIKENDVD